VSLRTRVLQTLVSAYSDLKKALTIRLGCSELASDALHDTYVRLESANIRAVDNPRAYVFRAALNVAHDHMRSRARRLTVDEVDELLETAIADESPAPARIAEAQSDIRLLEQALEQLSARQRDIFHSSFIDEVPHTEVARRLGVSVRTVQMELKAAVEHCVARLDQNTVRRFAKTEGKTS
jgi:RNA polymerase sigma-70 factor (ECF subfamily)